MIISVVLIVFELLELKIMWFMFFGWSMLISCVDSFFVCGWLNLVNIG